MVRKKTITFLLFDKCCINGSLFDNFEYYCLFHKVFGEEFDIVYKIYTEFTREQVTTILLDRYIELPQIVWDKLRVNSVCGSILVKNPRVSDLLFCATNSDIYWFLDHNNILIANQTITLADIKPTHDRVKKYYKNYRTMYDDRLFEFDDLGEPYRKKLYFDIFKKKSYGAKYDYMINLSIPQRVFPKSVMLDLFEQYEGEIAIYVGKRNWRHYLWTNKLDNVHLLIPPIEDFMGMFHTLIYVPYNDGWDATPRLIPECKFYGKKVIYHDIVDRVKAGGYYRMLDTKENFDGLWLREDDEIIRLVRALLK